MWWIPLGIIGGVVVNELLKDDEPSTCDNYEADRRRVQRRAEQDREAQIKREAQQQILDHRSFLNNKYSLGLSEYEMLQMSDAEFKEVAHQSAYYRDLQQEVKDTSDQKDWLDDCFK